ncbi:MAG: hypothetical protein MZW92_45060 [Comamonadaceae bacterium]|nr:hypothetical protein [Comamonadaceae bacterium]
MADGERRSDADGDDPGQPPERHAPAVSTLGAADRAARAGRTMRDDARSLSTRALRARLLVACESAGR